MRAAAFTLAATSQSLQHVSHLSAAAAAAHVCLCSDLSKQLISVISVNVQDCFISQKLLVHSKQRNVFTA